MVNQEYLNDLVKQYAENRISKEDLTKLIGHVNNPEETEAVYSAMHEIWISPGIVKHHTKEDVKAFHRKMIGDPLYKKARKVKLWPKIAVAASVLIALSAGLWFYEANQRNIKVQSQIVRNPISPGRNTAMLTLSDGKRINLSETKSAVVIDASKITYNDGTKIDAGKPGNDLTITTPAGGTYQVHLSDGTKVWLNAASTFKFPSSFTKSKHRNVEVIGEAYFEVAKDKGKSFIVSSGQQEVEVLGTHFNIDSYADEQSIKTTLLEGSVRVSIQNSSISSFLKPGMQSILTKSGIKIHQMDNPEEAISWQKGYFTFRRENLDQIMRKISRWYNVNIVYNDQQIKSIPFSGSITRFTNVSEVLKIPELTGKVQFKIEGKTIIVDRK